ncbi:MAG: GNAT family N-acetyltransferase [Chloroflexota bacterium]|nr:GNAT family N-acetyltransferase [Chloroflexota bacterium]
MAPTIRPAEARDIDCLLAIYRPADDLAAELLPGFFKPAAGYERPRTEIEAQLADADALVLVAEDARGVIGLLMAALRESPPWAGFVRRCYVEVVDLAVDAAARREGVGRLLMDAAEAWARERGADSVDLTVVEGNAPALALYENLGYRMRSHRMWKRLDR